MKKICVIGSFNIDIMASVEGFPRTSETVRCDSFDLFIGGGKGANQAIALGKLNADVMMVGRLGDQFFGPKYINVLEKNNVNYEAVDIIEGATPGMAFVAVDAKGDNILFIYPGTNGCVDIEYIDKHWDSIVACDIFLFQLEIPIETNLYAMKKLKALGKTVILDPAPAMKLPEETYSLVDYMTPNEVELMQLSGMEVIDSESCHRAAKSIVSKGTATVIAKAGKKGAYIIDNDHYEFVPSIKVNAIDPTAAGDSFNAGFSYALAQGDNLIACVSMGNIVAGLSTEAMGAQTAMPTREQVKNYIKQQESEGNKNE